MLFIAKTNTIFAKEVNFIYFLEYENHDYSREAIPSTFRVHTKNNGGASFSDETKKHINGGLL